MSQWTALEEYVPGEGDVAMILTTEEDELDNSTSAISSSSLLGTPSADNTTIFSQPTPDSHLLQEVPTRHSRTSHTTTSTKSSQKAAPQSFEDTRTLSRARARSSKLADQTSGKQSQSIEHSNDVQTVDEAGAEGDLESSGEEISTQYVSRQKKKKQVVLQSSSTSSVIVSNSPSA